MHRRTQLALLGAILVALAVPAGAIPAATVGASAGPAAPAAFAGPPVTVRIEGSKKTLLLPTTVTTRSGFITKFGAPSGKCPAGSGQGALDKATRGRWTGTWNAQFNEYFITSILGEKPAGKNFWEIFADNKAAQVGACDLKLHAGEQLLFADESGKVNPASLRAPRRAAVGRRFNVKLVGYNAKGKAKPLVHVLIIGDNGVVPVFTDRQGNAKLSAPVVGNVILRAAPKGYVRTEAVVHVAA